MTSELRPYPEYKDSGLPWLGRIPAHWSIERAKWLYQKMARPVREEDEVVTCFRDGTVTLRKRRRELGFTNSLKEIGYQGVREGDLVIHAMDAFAGAVGVSDSDGKCTPVYAICTPKIDIDNRYYAYVVREMARSAWILALARGIRERSTDFRFDTFGAQPVPLPPRDEQKAIADYLDAISVKIRRFIRNRRRLIAVLNEQKQAIINRAVTRGLDPNARLKPSGIDWLGDIPSHWELVPLRHVARVQTGITLGKNYGAQPLVERPYLRVANVQAGRLDLRTVKTIAVPPSEAAACELRPGDVLMTEGGDIDKLGRGGVWHGEIDSCLHQNHVFAVRVNRSRLYPEYLTAIMASRYGRIYFEITAKRTTNLAATNSSKLRAFVLPLPPLDEQTELLSCIESEAKDIDALASRAASEIDLIREYRTRLIADVVTGKVDVRGLASADQLQTDEPLDDDFDDEEMLGDDEAELVEEAADADG